MASIKRFLGKIASPLVTPLQVAKNRVYSNIQQFESIIELADQRVKERTSDQVLIAAMQQSRETLYQVWGIEENQVSMVKKGLMLEATLYLLISLVPVLGLFSDIKGFVYWVALIVATPICIAIASIKLWRLDCITEGRLMSYKNWLKIGW